MSRDIERVGDTGPTHRLGLHRVDDHYVDQRVIDWDNLE